MNIASGIIIVIVMALFVPATTVAIYLIFYRRRINKRLAEGKVSGKPMMSPLAFFVVTFICVTAAAFLIIAFLSYFLWANVKSVGRVGTDGFDGPVPASIRMLHEEELNDSPFCGYTAGGELKGYEKYETTNGDVTFYYYMVENSMQGVLPRLMVCPVCDKEQEYPMVDMHANFKYGSKETDWSCSAGNGVLYAIDCDGFEGTMVMTFCCFSQEQEEMVNEPGQLYDEEFMKKAAYSGRLELDMAYPEPEE